LNIVKGVQLKFSRNDVATETADGIYAGIRVQSPNEVDIPLGIKECGVVDRGRAGRPPCKNAVSGSHDSTILFLSKGNL
jgi:hypothetical protein